jgi:hypothetical protein
MRENETRRTSSLVLLVEGENDGSNESEHVGRRIEEMAIY